MNIKISRQRFNEILKEEVEKYRKIKELESERKKIEDALLKIQESRSEDELNEIIGGLGKLFQTGAQKVGTSYQNAKNNLNQKANQVKQAVQTQAQNIKQVYQQGEQERAIKVAKAEIQKLWAERQRIQTQLNLMQNKYQSLTGKKLGNQFQAKTPAQTQTNQTPPAAAAE